MSIITRLTQYWQFDCFEPILAEQLHQINQLIEPHRFGDEGVGSQLVNPFYVCIRLGSGQNDNWNGAQLGIGLDIAQRFPAVLAWHVEVQDDQSWSPAAARAAVFTPLRQVIHELLAIFDET